MKQKQKALTLVEVMIVVAILGLLVSIGIPGFIRSRDKARKDACISNLRMIEHASDQFRIDNNLAIDVNTDVVDLWPATTDGKDVSSYINKQLFCPDEGQYVGGNSAGTNGYYTSDPEKYEITANGVPHCWDGVTANKNTNADNPDFEHKID